VVIAACSVGVRPRCRHAKQAMVIKHGAEYRPPVVDTSETPAYG